MNTNPRFIISGGGTGGHIFPALAIADALKARHPQASILFVGALGRMEMQRVPDAGYPIVGLPIKGFDRSHLLNNFHVLFLLARSLYGAWKTIRRFRPHAVIGVGGYASGPTLFIASLAGVPTLIQEQNSYAGVTNKLLARRAHAICVAYHGMKRFFPPQKIILTGNPVRNALLQPQQRTHAADFFGLDPQKKTLLVIGGSLGARTINLALQAGLPALEQAGIQLIWQTGKYYTPPTPHTPAQGRWIAPFIDRMDFAYAAADLVISRAGAGTISELCLLAKPAILVPSPNVAEDHQTKNARALVDKEAALLVSDKQAPQDLIPSVLALIRDENRLARLASHIAPLGAQHSAQRIADAVDRIAHCQMRYP
ncbi:MAG: undecaprenyldiphospho-muramoylpentapeptide beta-N-acetylglucosaminyltransferase [Tannerellaceae bacterium]|jgi:UDP-N-acetylglucosamine--N-acetylmuramyl-(pentapeptide) pyrophosphoryl-undecaprenol N-acetylglucosamine transferase|nr:undecaprenyldiphospho-muramoylpentapeptide beta-N-acetylglucosaminyltransferase [Tannerellaceae bacterium]